MINCWTCVVGSSKRVACCYPCLHIPYNFYSKNEGQWADADDLGWRSGGNHWWKQAFDSRRGACCPQGGRVKALYAEGRCKVAIPWKDGKPPLYCNRQILLDAIDGRTLLRNTVRWWKQMNPRAASGRWSQEKLMMAQLKVGYLPHFSLAREDKETTKREDSFRFSNQTWQNKPWWYHVAWTLTAARCFWCTIAFSQWSCSPGSRSIWRKCSHKSPWQSNTDGPTASCGEG